MKRWLSNLLIIVFVLIFVVSGYFLGKYLLDSRQQQAQFDELVQLVVQARPTAPVVQEQTPENAETAAPNPTEPVSELISVIDPKTGETVQVLPEYAQLYQMNSDMAGWISIPDTKINYPVMYAPDRTDYYLYRDFYGADSSHGCIYIREQCDVTAPSDNVVIYGHRMKDRTMFGSLSDYEKQTFYKSHKYIQFNTLRERHTYEILAVFKTVASESGYPYYQFVEAADEADFATYIADCKAMSLYDTGVDAVYGDKLITLSTCEYTQNNGRLVIVAKQIQ